MTILTFIEMLIRIFMLSESFDFFTLFMAFDGLNFTIIAVSGATRPLGGRVARLSEAGSNGSFERSYMDS